jgi:hypothetical protein
MLTNYWHRLTTLQHFVTRSEAICDLFSVNLGNLASVSRNRNRHFLDDFAMFASASRQSKSQKNARGANVN